jgi:Na+-translocating ferredoxin:NAD+ oxidoreductase RnfD subunit
MRWTTAAVLRPITFVLAIVAAVIVGNHSDSFWYGLLTWFIAMAVGRAVGALVRNLPRRALYKAIWPVAATVFALLFAALGLPPWASFFVSFIAASLAKQALGGLIPGGRRWTRSVEWRRIDLDELLP